MNKKLKIAIIIVIFIAIIISSYFLFFGKEDDSTDDPLKKTGSGGSTTTTYANFLTKNATFPLKVGVKGKEVGQLQNYLNVTESANLVVDGDFGSITEKALLRKCFKTPIWNIINSCESEVSKELFTSAKIGNY